MFSCPARAPIEPLPPFLDPGNQPLGALNLPVQLLQVLGQRARLLEPPRPPRAVEHLLSYRNTAYTGLLSALIYKMLGAVALSLGLAIALAYLILDLPRVSISRRPVDSS